MYDGQIKSSLYVNTLLLKIGIFFCLNNMFIGSSINIGNRLVYHLVNEDTKEHFQNAIALYGLDTFTFVVVEVYEVYPQLLRNNYMC